MRENGENKLSPPTGLKPQSPPPADPVTSEDLPRSVSIQLYGLMNEVTRESVTPQSVAAACKCAAEIQKMLKINLEMMKFRAER